MQARDECGISGRQGIFLAAWGGSSRCCLDRVAKREGRGSGCERGQTPIRVLFPLILRPCRHLTRYAAPLVAAAHRSLPLFEAALRRNPAVAVAGIRLYRDITRHLNASLAVVGKVRRKRREEEGDNRRGTERP